MVWHKPMQVIDFIGGRTRTRTWDPLIKSQLLYQLSYAPYAVVFNTQMRIEAFLFLPAARHRLSRILMPAQLIPHLGVERQAARGYKEFGARSPQRLGTRGARHAGACRGHAVGGAPMRRFDTIGIWLRVGRSRAAARRPAKGRCMDLFHIIMR